MIYDCFTFYNELELLQLRLEELHDLADRFVLVEATRTYRKKKKNCVYKTHADMFEGFNSKIIHVIVDDMPNSSNAWDLEYHLRNSIMRGVSHCNDDDIILISDVDEIPRKAAVRSLISQIRDEFVTLHMPLYYYYLNCKLPADWCGTVVTRYELLKQSAPQFLKTNKEYFRGIPDAGWHFSYLGGIDRIVEKIATATTVDYDTAYHKDQKRLELCLRSGKDLYERQGMDGVFVEIDDTYPETITKNLSRFRPYIWTPERKQTALLR